MMFNLPHTYEAVEGWFDWHETYRRWSRDTPRNGIIVEVGVYQGKSLAFLMVELANLARNDVEVHAVDNWAGVGDLMGDALEQRFVRNMEVLPLHPTVHRLSSLDAATYFDNLSVDRLWLDGSHEEQDVWDDVDAWWPKIKVGGEMGGHDLTSHPAVRRALSRWCAQHGLSYAELPSCVTSGPMTTSWLMVKAHG